jgi:DNA processing protein
MANPLIYKIGLTLIDGVGDVFAKKLLAYCGSAEAVFKEKKQKLMKIPGVGSVLADAIVNQQVIERAEEEALFIEKHKITPLFFTDAAYPERLKQCEDAPVMLYYMGSADLNVSPVISIVGTRKATEYGKELTRKLIDELSIYKPLIVSGLAYGIDIEAHRAALKNNLATVGVLAHGLHTIYPSTHKETAKKMLENGGLITDFISEAKPDKENFPKRNRIVAGICDAVVVIESGEKGGSLITADIANTYNRDVFAFPGKTTDSQSAGCNRLIKQNKAALIENADDLAYLMGWEKKDMAKKETQPELFITLDADEHKLVEILNTKGKSGIDILSIESGLTMSKTSAVLLNLEFKNLIKSFPGKVYEAI